MVNPLHLLSFRTRRVPQRRRRPAPVPTSVPTTDAIFLVLRRMRLPFLVVAGVFSVATIGMMLMPGVDPQGHAYHMSPFDAFYQMTITLTTVGYTEAPYPFSYAQRMWMTGSIYALVVSWAYAIGAFFALLQDPAFQHAVAGERFRRRVERLREPFLILAGYGHTGRMVGHGLDERGRRFVVVDDDRARLDLLATDQLTTDVAGTDGDCRTPAVLGLAGLGHPSCQGLLAMTDDDEANLAALMTVSLLRPDLPVIARCTSRRMQRRMEDFSPRALINPDDRYGGYLAMALQRPVSHQVLVWLMDNDEHELPALRTGLRDGRWVVCADGTFGQEVTSDLRAAGLDVDLVDPQDGDPELAGAAGFVAGTSNDTANIAMAEHARIANADAYVCVRQSSDDNQPLFAALDVDSVYIASDLVARETLARVLTPRFFGFLERAVEQDEQWATALRDELVARCGTRTPQRDVLTVDATHAPALVAWLRHHRLTIADLLRHPGEREDVLPVVVLMLVRDGQAQLTPPGSTTLEVGDELLLAARSRGLDALSETLFHSATVEYVATGRELPQTWVWRAMTRRLRARAVLARRAAHKRHPGGRD